MNDLSTPTAASAEPMTQEQVRAQVAALSAFAAPRRESPWRRVLRSFVASRTAMFGLVVALILMIAALAAPWLTPQNPYDLMQLDVLDARLAPGSANGLGTFTYWLGTDGQGRDLYSGILYGLRISIGIGIGSALLAGIIGTLVGLLAAYVGGKVDALLMRLADLVLSFPSILVSMLILAYLGKGIFNVMATLVVLEWAYYARTARGQALVERQKEYVEAARGLGVSGWRIMVRHILPNCLPPLIVIGTLQIARAITLEATLSFLGLGVPITEPSLGLLISNGYQYMLSGEYWISFYPGIALLVVIVAINLVGDRLRDVMNPRWQK
jgi:peptide/nickel transport system permease protein